MGSEVRHVKSREVRHVEWIDSTSASGWMSHDDLADHGISECSTVGFVLREDDRQVLLVQSEDHKNRNLDSVMAIPKVAITKSTTIRKAKT